jgi:hypothetical protein
VRKLSVQVLLVLALASGSGRAEELTEFASKEGGFKVLLPGKPEDREVRTPRGTMHVVHLPSQAGEYLAGWIDLPLEAADAAEKIEARLDRARDGILERLKGKLVRERKIALDDKHPGRDLRAEITKPQEGQIRARLYLVDRRLYQVIVVGTKAWTESKEADMVLESFQLSK